MYLLYDKKLWFLVVMLVFRGVSGDGSSTEVGILTEFLESGKKELQL